MITTQDFKKLALVIGINYKNNKDAALNGCINDAHNLSDLLQKKYNYTAKDIVLLTDDTVTKPTYKNICAVFTKIAKQTHNEKVKEVFISFSGHGSYTYDNKSEERDNRDECIVPLDYEINGCIYDDSINNMLGGIRKGVRVSIVIDACHSGSVCDLKYRYVAGRKTVIENKKCNVETDCVMISGCRDNQVSLDAFNLQNNNKYNGAMTSALLHTLYKYDYCISCFQLLKEMKRYLKSRKFRQVPQITCTRRLSCASLFSCVDPKPFLTE